MSLPPAWVDISDDVSSEMNKVKSNMADLAKSHGRALMVSFDDSTGEQHTIELLTTEITRSLKKCEQKLHRLSGGQGVSGDENLRKNVQVYEVLNKFQAKKSLFYRCTHLFKGRQ